MYKLFIFIIINFALSTAVAQEFSFQRTRQPTTNQQNSSDIVPAREAALSPQGFANSTSKAYQNQQAKVSALAAQKIAEDQVSSNKSTAKPSSSSAQQPAATTGTLPTGTSKPVAQPAANQPPPEPSPSQPYTGFQGQSAPPPSNQDSGSGSSSNWGSGIQY